MSGWGVIYSVCSLITVASVGVKHGAADAAIAMLMRVLGGAILEDINDHNDDHRQG